MTDVRVLEKRCVFDDIFKIDEAVVAYRKHDGSWSEPLRQLSFERGDSVAALLINRDTGTLVLVEQFRYPTHERGPGWLTEIVAGGIGLDETPEAAIRREIQEETGYTASALRPVVTFYVSPGGTSERVHLFYGEVGGPPSMERPPASEDEDLAIVEKSLDGLWDDFHAGRLLDAKTIIALLWLRTRQDDTPDP